MFTIPSMFWPAIYFGVTLGITAVIAALTSLLIRGLMRQSNPSVSSAAQRLGFLLVWLVGIVIAVQQAGVAVYVLLVVIALLGIAGVVALRLPLENFGAKYFADVYSPFKVGDTVRVGEFAGKVIEVNAMTTVLLTEDDTMVALPNARMLREPIVNLTPQAWKELTVPITLPASVDLATFESDMVKALAKLRTRLDRRYPPVFTTKARSTQSSDLVLTLMVRRPEDREPVLAEANRRLTEELDKARGGALRAPALSSDSRAPAETPKSPTP